MNGRIDITGIAGATEVRVTGTRLVGSNSIQDAYARMQGLAVQVQGLANEVSVQTLQPHDAEGRRYVVDYTITVPTIWLFS